jgi:hypothetical protein
LDDIRDDIKNAFRRWVNDNDGNIPDPETLKQLLNRVVRKLNLKTRLFILSLPILKILIPGLRMGHALTPKQKRDCK